MSKAIISPDQDAVVCEVQIAAPPERIFRALTSNDQLMRWWNGEGGPCRVNVWEIDPRVGGKWSCSASDPTGKMVINGVSQFDSFGEIVQFDPPRVLTYTRFANFHSIPSHQTLVRWELIPQSEGTLVRMTHSGLKALPGGTDYSQGWPGVIDALQKFAES
ncbi:MAG: SRPBCC domain-containing protein [Terriglobales bacterium]